MRSFLRKTIAFITLLFVLQQGLAVAFHSHEVDHAHDLARSCAICQAASTSKVTLTAPVIPTSPTFGFSQSIRLSFIIASIDFVSKIPPARAPPLV